MTVTRLPQRRGWVPDDTDFGARLAMVRQHLGGLNITKAAAICGVNPESWRMWEAGKTKPRDLTDVAGKIARATGADYLWLMVGSAVPEAVAGGREAAFGSIPEAPTRATGGLGYAAETQLDDGSIFGPTLAKKSVTSEVHGPVRLRVIPGGRDRHGVAA